MKKYNKKEVYIYNTLQMYRTDRLNYLNEIISIAKKENFTRNKTARGHITNKKLIEL